jgi:hypothetical protein
MTLCKDCKNWINTYSKRNRNACHCTENIMISFNPVYGERFYLKHAYYENIINNKGNCIYFEQVSKRKWWKIWSKKRVETPTPTLIGNKGIDTFLTFLREKYPEVVMEYMLVDEVNLAHGGIVSNRPKPTPIPTNGIKR